MNSKQAVQIFKILMQGSASRLELAERSGATAKAVSEILQEMRAENMVYVLGYSHATDGRNRVKIYTFGEGEDAQPIPSKTQEERSRRSYSRKVAATKETNVKTTFVGGKGLWQ